VRGFGRVGCPSEGCPWSYEGPGPNLWDRKKRKEKKKGLQN